MSDHVVRRVAYPDHPDTVCDHCEGDGTAYAQNRAPVHVHEVDGEFFQWPARPVMSDPDRLFECSVCGRNYPKDRPYSVPCWGNRPDGGVPNGEHSPRRAERQEP